MFASTIALFIFCIGIKRQGRLNRLEGGAFVLAYAAYTYWLIRQLLFKLFCKPCSNNAYYASLT